MGKFRQFLIERKWLGIIVLRFYFLPENMIYMKSHPIF